ncbi:MAG: hypothetical protein JSR61_21000 [Proteobacteria bacterium]|nr:hypothetical protein [Pseudomonadota bacterium]
MKKQGAPSAAKTKEATKGGGFVMGHARFSKISAVEGIELTPAMKARKSQFDNVGASAAERRDAIIKAHKR